MKVAGSEISRDPESRADEGPWKFLGLISAGFALYWLALPPLGLWPLGWLVLAPWTVAVSRSVDRLPRLPWKRLWGLSTLFWMAVFYFIPLPHPALWVAWPLLSMWCGLFPLAFFLVSRRIAERWSCPELLFPVVWTCLEWGRNWLLTGFGMGMLAHSQYRQEWIVPLAAVGGSYLVSLVMGLAGVALAIWFVPRGKSSRWSVFAVSAGLVAASTGIVHWHSVSVRLANTPTDGADPSDQAAPLPADRKGVNVAIIQGSIDTEFPELSDDPERAAARIERRMLEEYRQLTVDARRRWPETELVIWPETMFGVALILDDPDEIDDSSLRSALDAQASRVHQRWLNVTGQLPSFDLAADGPPLLPVAMLTGVTAIRVNPAGHFNSAMLIQTDGVMEGVYHKNHRVIFGEYFPLVRSIPFLKSMLQGMSDLDRGENAKALTFGGLTWMPEICFETTVPHLVRKHWLELNAAGQTPDCIVCVTNDGWFFGTSCLDLHLACNVFRAAETATPLLVSANTGFSAEIDAQGRILQQGPRRQMASLRARVSARPPGTTLWLQLGDKPMWFLSGIILLASLVRRPAKKN